MSKRELLRKYLDGDCSPEELQRLYHYLRQDDTGEYDPLLLEVWQQLSVDQSLSPAASDRIYRKVAAATQLPTVSSSYRRFLLPSAAASLGLLLVGWLIYRQFFPPFLTYQTTYGEIRQVTLPDRSVVDLNANSQLKLSTTFADDPRREVWLTGEAYFHVESKQQPTTGRVPFVVHTTHLDVEVLGTAFNVKDRRGTTDVLLNSGRVLLKNRADSAQALTMTPGDKASVSESQPLVLTRVPEPAVYTSWKEHELYFEDQSLAAIQRELADRYDVALRFGDPTLGQLRFTGSAPPDSLIILLKTIQNSFNLTLQPRRDGYLLTR